MGSHMPDGKQTVDSPTKTEQPHHIADEPLGEVDTGEPEVRPAVTDTGLPVEQQVEKEWDPNKDGGLPTFLHIPRS